LISTRIATAIQSIVLEAAEWSFPFLVGLSMASGLLLSAAFNLLPFLQYLFTSPLLLLARRKKKGVGLVYNSVSKQPVDLAIVRLYQIDQGEEKLIRSRVTDKQGQYSFLINEGTYRLEVLKQGYEFPSNFAQKPAHQVKENLYFGDIFEVAEDDFAVTYNVPLDTMSEGELNVPTKLIWRRRMRKLQHAMAYVGVVVAVFYALVVPSTIAFVLAFVQIAV
jgi:hypothetical protein